MNILYNIFQIIYSDSINVKLIKDTTYKNNYYNKNTLNKLIINTYNNDEQYRRFVNSVFNPLYHNNIMSILHSNKFYLSLNIYILL